MEIHDHLDALAGASDAAADAAASAGIDADVPSCPGWKVRDLLLHMAGGDLWARTIVETQSVQRVANDVPEDHPEGEALVDWYREGAHRLVAALGAVDPAVSVWTFSASDRTARFWIRRRACETTVHRYDAQLAAGDAEPVDAAVAVDGVDEFTTVFLPRLGADVLPDGATIHLHATDADGEWLLAGSPDGVRVSREHAKGDVAARGRASDLYLFLWGRVPQSTLEVFGDAAVLAAFRDASHI